MAILSAFDDNVSRKSSCGCGGAHVEGVLFVVSDSHVGARVEVIEKGPSSSVFDRIDSLGVMNGIVELINAINLSQQLNAEAVPSFLRLVRYGWNNTC
jgi:hypothetical protein